MFEKIKRNSEKKDTLWNHLALNGFMSNYSLWTKHGEIGVMMEDNEEDDDGDNNFPDWAWVHEACGFQDEPMDGGEANVPQEISFADSLHILVSLDNLCWMLRHLFVFILLATIMPI